MTRQGPMTACEWCGELHLPGQACAPEECRQRLFDALAKARDGLAHARDRALKEAAAKCNDVPAEANDTTMYALGYRNGVAWCGDRIRALVVRW